MLTMARIDRPNEQTNIDLFTFRKAKSENTCCRTVVEIDRAGHRYDKANFALRLRDYRICGQSVLSCILVGSTDVKYETDFPA